MAEMVDVDESIGEIEAEEAKVEVVEKSETVVDEDVGIPDHLKVMFKGKSRAEIAKVVAEQEKIISRQGQEVGEVRKLADELLKQQTAKKEQPKEVDIFENPQEAIRQAIESNPRVLAAESSALEAQRYFAKKTLYEKHPDVDGIIADPAFHEFVGQSKFRKELLQRADQQYDVEAADELFSTYKALTAAKTKIDDSQVKADAEARKKEVSSVSVDTGGAGESSKKIYRRADLIRLKLSNPSKYDAMQEEISLAYQQGRVR